MASQSSGCVHPSSGRQAASGSVDPPVRGLAGSLGGGLSAGVLLGEVSDIVTQSHGAVGPQPNLKTGVVERLMLSLVTFQRVLRGGKEIAIRTTKTRAVRVVSLLVAKNVTAQLGAEPAVVATGVCTVPDVLDQHVGLAVLGLVEALTADATHVAGGRHVGALMS